MDAMDWNAYGDVRASGDGVCFRRVRMERVEKQVRVFEQYDKIVRVSMRELLVDERFRNCRFASCKSELRARESVAVGWGDVRHRRDNGNIYGCKDCAKRVERCGKSRERLVE